MNYPEKFGEEDFSQQEDKISDINDKITNYEENQNNSININNYNNPTIKKKNRTLQYYKFLFYSMKTEIKVNDFLKLLRNTNTLELSLWSISVVLFANVPKNFPILKEGEKNKKKYNGTFIWFHLFHIIHAFFGMYIGYKLPRSFQIMDSLQSLTREKLAKTLFNDLIREILYDKVVLVVKKHKIFVIIYFIVALINIFIDVIEFFYFLINIPGISDSARVEFLTYFFINVIYLISNFTYFFFFGQLKYIFPRIYIDSISRVYLCVTDAIKVLFKLKKEKTDIIEENKAQQKKGPFVSGSDNNGGYNLLEHIVRDSFGMSKEDNMSNYGDINSNKYLPNYNENNINNKRGINGNIGGKDFPDSNEIMN